MARKRRAAQSDEETAALETKPLSVTEMSAAECECLSQEQAEQGASHISDSELITRPTHTNVGNKRILLPKKSYSFLDKPYDKSSKLMKMKNGKLKEIHNIPTEQGAVELGRKRTLLKSSKMKKTKSLNDAENLPEIMVEPQETMINKPQSQTLTPPTKKKTNKKKKQKKATKASLDDIGVGVSSSSASTAFKRESFIRHSLQTIRRSFSSSKRFQTSPTPLHSVSQVSTSSSSSSSSSSSASSVACSTTSSSSTTSSASSSASSFGSASFAQAVSTDNALSETRAEFKDIIGVYDPEKIAPPPAAAAATSAAAVLVAQSNSAALEEDEDNNNGSVTAAVASTTTTPLATTPATNATTDILTVLKEEDERDVLAATSESLERSTSSVSTLAYSLPDTTSMAPLQSHAEAQSVQCLNTLDKDTKVTTTTTTTTTSPACSTAITTTATTAVDTATITSQEPLAKRSVRQQLLSPESATTTTANTTQAEFSNSRSLKDDSSPLSPLVPVSSTPSFRSISPLRRSTSSNNSNSTAKHEHSTAAATAAAAAVASSTSTPPEKEKKRKEVSSSRVKKFHRHFTQVSKDEKLINYFSCALVSDILLQGHLYITDRHFAFYSNVFGYVTKVVIPTSSVTKISKEKTAKIIPNAVGVATADERHVFGSFISREAAFRLMCSVCPPLAPAEILPKVPADIEISEEYSIEDDSSCSISGNESPPQAAEMGGVSDSSLAVGGVPSQTLLRRSVGSSNLSIADGSDKLHHSDIPANAKTGTNPSSSNSVRVSTSPAAHLPTNSPASSGRAKLSSKTKTGAIPPDAATPTTSVSATCTGNNLATLIAANTSTTTSATSTPTPSNLSSSSTTSSSSPPTTVMALPRTAAQVAAKSAQTFARTALQRLKELPELHIVYAGIILTLFLTIFSIFLLYRILDIEDKANSYRSPFDFNWLPNSEDDIFTEALRFQKELQAKSTEEVQNILKTNLEQIAKVRRSLETLSMLIHDRRSDHQPFETTAKPDDSD